MNNAKADGITDINITPFVDVVLVLLVIFMVTAPIMFQQVINVKLPSSKSADQTATDTLGLAVTADGQFLLNGVVTAKNVVLSTVKTAVANNKNVQVIIAADGEAFHKYVINAIDIINQAGVENFAFQVTKTKRD